MIIILIILFSVSQLICKDLMAGSVYQFGSNAREIGLSNALVSNYNKGNNTFTNPGLLGFVDKPEYGFSHFSMSLDRSIQSFSVVVPMPTEDVAIGVSFFKAGTKKIPFNDSQPDDYKTLGYYSVWEGYAMLTFGTRITEKLSCGANLKIYRNEIMEEYTANGFGADLGFIYKISNKNQLGVLINDLYSRYSWDFEHNGTRAQYDEKFPVNLLLGFSSHINDRILSLSQIDYNNDDGKFSYKSAVEISILNLEKVPCKVRTGINYGDNDFDYSLGFGLYIPIKNNFNIGIDYAIDTAMNDTFNHLFSLTFYKGR
tara:strand:- start:148 stop:1089 length:942 start_codon:yes stop_codon:yes gene_type:complete